MARSDLVQALERGLKILELASVSADGLTIAQMVSALGVKQPAAHNLARTLVAHGYLVRRHAPIRYALGPAAVALAQRRGRQDWQARAEAVVRELARQQPEATVILAEWRAGDLPVFLRLHPSHPGHVERNPATRLSPYTSACTLCFQAFAPAPEVSEFRQRYPFGESDAGKWSGHDALDRFLKEVRQAGVLELCDDRLERVAVPVWSAEGRVTAILGASRGDPRQRATGDWAAFRSAVSDAAAQLSEAPVVPPANDRSPCVSTLKCSTQKEERC